MSHVFLLYLTGFASGTVLLALSGYRQASPSWLKWLLWATGAFLLTRYFMTILALQSFPEVFFQIHHYRWAVATTCLGIPGLFVIDQMLRHPAMSPEKFARIALPVIVLQALCVVLSDFVPWIMWLSFGIYQLTALGLVGFCLRLMFQVPNALMKRALAALIFGFGCLAVEGLISLQGNPFAAPGLLSEIITLIALWYAYEASATLRQTF